MSIESMGGGRVSEAQAIARNGMEWNRTVHTVGGPVLLHKLLCKEDPSC